MSKAKLHVYIVKTFTEDRIHGVYADKELAKAHADSLVKDGREANDVAVLNFSIRGRLSIHSLELVKGKAYVV